MFLEICVSGVEDAVKAQAAGADRIELCARLDLGGLTPDKKEIAKAHQLLNIPFRVMIRCRPGNFVYSPSEILRMEEQAAQARDSGADGIVFGALLPDGAVDSSSLLRIKKAASPLPVTFHRAFDECNNPEEAILTLIQCRCATLLTSGMKTYAWQGLPLIKKLQVQYGDKIEIMAGSGITDLNAEEIIRSAGVTWIHASAGIISQGKKVMSEEMIRNIRKISGRYNNP